MKNSSLLRISKIVFSDIRNSFLDIQNNYFGYLKKWINVNSACHSCRTFAIATGTGQHYWTRNESGRGYAGMQNASALAHNRQLVNGFSAPIVTVAEKRRVTKIETPVFAPPWRNRCVDVVCDVTHSLSLYTVRLGGQRHAVTTYSGEANQLYTCAP